MKIKLTLLLLCFCSSVFSETYILTQTSNKSETRNYTDRNFTLIINKTSENLYIGKKELRTGNKVLGEVDIKYSIVDENGHKL